MQTSLFPTKSVTITQTAGIDRNNNALFTTSHQENRANDLCPADGKLYAPFDMKCVMQKNITHSDGSVSPYMAVFVSDEEVLTPSGRSKVTIFCTHGGGTINTAAGILKVDSSFKQGDHFYTQGTDGGKDAEGNDIEYGAHVHIDVRLGGDFTALDLTPVYKRYYLSGDAPIEDVFYDNETTLNFKPFLDVREFSLVKSGEWNGWIADGDNWYFYENGNKFSGWLQNPENSGIWYYLDPNNDCAMATGWRLIDNLYYYFNPKDGASNHIAGLAGGQMVRSHWVASGTNWYYVKESGIMAKSETLTINGKSYNFDSNGICLNP